MIGFLSAYDEDEKSADKAKISFVHINASTEDDIQKEIAPVAVQFSRQLNLKKVYLFYGKEGKIIYEYLD